MKKILDKYLQTLRSCPNKKATCVINLVIALLTGFGFCGFLAPAFTGDWFAIFACPVLFVWCVDGIVSSFILRKYLKMEKTDEIQEKNQ